MGYTLRAFDLVSDRCIDRPFGKNKYPGDRLLVISTSVYLHLHEINILVWMSDKQIPMLGIQVRASIYVRHCEEDEVRRSNLRYVLGIASGATHPRNDKMF